MYRATTPKHTFIFDVDPTETFRDILISYAQDNQIILEKGKDDLTVEQATGCNDETVWEASLTLTQEETNLFNAGSTVKIQIRALTYEDEVVASEKMSVPVYDVLNDQVLE